MERTQEILKGNLWKVIIKLTIPVLLTNFIQTLYNLTDTYFVSRIGGEQVAAITFVWPIVFLVISIGTGLSVAGLSMIAQSIGRGDKKEIRENMQQLIYLSMIISIVLGILGFLFSGSALKLMGIKGVLLSESIKYIRWILLGTPATFMILSHSSIRKAEGKNVKPMLVNIISICANVVLNPIFIFHLKMGITGAAIATIIAKFGAAVYCFYDLRYKNEENKLDLFLFKISLEKAEELIRVGVPAAISQATTSFGFILLNIYVKEYGAEVLAAYGIGNRIHSVFFMPAGGIAATLSAIVGQNYGAKNYQRVKEAVKKGMIISLSFSILGAIILQIYTKEFAGIFAKDSLTLYHSVNYMKLVSLTVIAWGVFQVYFGFFQGLGKTKIALKINMIRLWGLRIPLVIILSQIGIFKEYSVWNSMFFSNIFTALASIIIYKRFMQKSAIFQKKSKQKVFHNV